MGNKTSQANIPENLKNSPYFNFIEHIFEDVSTVEDNARIVTLHDFRLILFGDQNASIAILLYKYFMAFTPDHEDGTVCHDCDFNLYDEGLKKVAFVSGFDKLLKLECGSKDMVKFYFEVLSKGKQELSAEDITTILYSVYSPQYLQEDHHSADSAKHLEVIAQSLLLNGKDTVDKDVCAKRMFEIWPRLFNYVHSWILTLLQSRHKLLKGSSEIVFHWECQEIRLLYDSCTLDAISLWLLSVSIPVLYLKSCQKEENKHEGYLVSEWSKLYDSNEHGLSQNRFKHHCFSYRGPTVMGVLMENGVKFALVVDVEWSESTRRFGNSGTRLYQIYPHFKVLAEKNIVLFNEKSRGCPVGLTLGNNPSEPQISLVDGMTLARLGYMAMEETTVQRIEMWGCAGIKAETDQKLQQKWERRQAEHQQKVKLPGAWDENPDKALLGMAGITTEHAQR